MKKVSIQELKRDLSSILTEAGEGTEVIITRHNRPIARLNAAEREHLHAGSLFGRGNLQPVLRGATQGRYLKVLTDDRRGHRDSR